MLSHFSQQMESMHYSPHLLTARWEFRWPEARDAALTRWFNDVKNIMFFTEKQQVVNWFQTSHEEGEIDLVFNMMEVEHQKILSRHMLAVAFVNRPECIDVEPPSIEHVGYDEIENTGLTQMLILMILCRLLLKTQMKKKIQKKKDSSPRI